MKTPKAITKRAAETIRGSRPNTVPNAARRSKTITPVTPPNRVIRGQFSGIGRELRPAASSAMEEMNNTPRSHQTETPRLVTIRQPQAARARTGSRPAMPKNCKVRSATKAPGVPRRFSTAPLPTLLKEGSLGE